MAHGVGSGQGGVCESVSLSVQQEILRTSAMGNPIPHPLEQLPQPPHLARAAGAHLDVLLNSLDTLRLWGLVFLAG